jgi:hypothetical protein
VAAERCRFAHIIHDDLVFTAGMRLGVYEVVAQIGEGGMDRPAAK